MGKTDGFHKFKDTTSIHIVVPTYLFKFIEKLAEAHNTSRADEINTCILIRYLNYGEK